MFIIYNCINGRCKNAIVNVKLDVHKFEELTKINVDDIIKLNIQKNLIGSALAGSIGGFNYHAANIIAGIFIGTGQDIAQIGTSSVCITDYYLENDKLNINLSMSSLEVGIIGGGTHIDTQTNCIDLMSDTKSEINNKTVNLENNANLSAGIISSTVLSGEDYR